MPNEPEEPRTDQEMDEEGGPVKSFLDHLEDLRWVLIKSLAALGIGMLICLIAGDRVVNILKRPLDNADRKFPGTNQIWTVYWGTNILKTMVLTDEQQAAYAIRKEHHVALKVDLVPNGTNGFIVGLREDPAADIAKARKMNISLVNLSPVGGFWVAMQVSLYGGTVLASPFIFYFIAGFIFPALRMREKHYVYRGLGFGLVLFAVGVSFCYFILMPLALSASAAYSNWLGFEANQWRAEDYISFVCKFMLGMGIGFQMPVVLLTLVKIGVLSYSALSKMRRYMIVINLILGALLTTPEVITQVMMAIPLQMLYECSVWIAWYWERRDRKREEAGRKREEEEIKRRGGATRET